MLNSLRLVLPLILLSATPAFAAEGGLLDINSGLMVWTVGIFLLVLIALSRFAYPAILGAVEAREARIRDLLASAERDRAEAEALLAQQQTERESVRAQVQEMLAEGRVAGERLRDEIVAEARREQQELIARTRRDLQQEMERNVAELRVQAVDLAIAAASKLIQRNLDEADNRRLVTEYLAQVDLGEPAPATAGA